jgi:outer membrane protein assembly factor BamD (BamD/ComL family)
VLGAAGVSMAILACAGGPDVSDPVAALGRAEEELAQGRPEAAREILEEMDEESFTGADLERYLLRLGQAKADTGDRWDAYKVIRNFSDDYAFSDYVNDVQDLEYRVGTMLIQDPGGFWFFGEDEDDGQVVLEHFVLHFPKHPGTPDALRLLGEKAYRDRDYFLARQRFRDLVLQHQNSEWVPLARFRIAMASFRLLVGPAYDLRSMLRAHNELQEFLNTRVENPAFRQEAVDALATVREWLGEKHLQIADFYHTIGNGQGERVHLQVAATTYPDTAAGEAAAARLPASSPTADPEEQR